MTLKENAETFHISRTVLADIIRVFLVGLSWETVDIGDMITDPVTNEVWCRWREVQGLRPAIVNHFKRSEATKALAIEIEKTFKKIEGELLDLSKVMDKHYVFFVKEKSPAFNAITRVAKGHYKPGMIIPVSKEELKSLEKDLLVVQVKEDD